MTSSVGVVGGTGYLGKRAVAALRRAGLDVEIHTRSSSPRFDLDDPSTYDVVAKHRVVVDLANATACSPVAFARHCIAHGHTLIETTSDASAIGDLIAACGDVEGPGSVVLGAGIFTGLSNLMARAVLRDVTAPDRLELFIASSPFSGAGKATVDLMAAALARRAFSFERGALVEHARVIREPNARFPSGDASTLRASFAEQLMLPRSTGVANVEVYFAPKPSILVPIFVATPGWLAASRAYRWFMGAYFRFLRGVVLRRRAGRVELLVRAQGSEGRAERALVALDGMLAGGAAIAAITEALARGAGAPRGLSFVDDVCELEPIARRTNELGGGVELTSKST